MGKVSKGDLAYIPSHTRMFRFHDGVLKQFIESINPIHVLVTGFDNNKDRVKVLYDGDYWQVHSKNVYQVEEK